VARKVVDADYEIMDDDKSKKSQKGGTMSVKTRDWLKFGTLVAMAFALGWHSPRRSGSFAGRRQFGRSCRHAPTVPLAKAAVDLGDAFASAAQHVKPAVVYIRSEHAARLQSPDTAGPRILQVPRRPRSAGHRVWPVVCRTATSSPITT
jgi:hypothetical protein